MSVPRSLRRPPAVQSKAGAVPVHSEKGDISMEKVRVKRYVSGKRPDYTLLEFSNEEDEEFSLEKKAPEQEAAAQEQEEGPCRDSRLGRFRDQLGAAAGGRLSGHQRRSVPPAQGDRDSEAGGDARRVQREESHEEEEEEAAEEEAERRRAEMRGRAKDSKNEETEVMEVEEEEGHGEESELGAECEEDTDSEEEPEPPLKSVFTGRKDRVTLRRCEAEAAKQKEPEQEAGRTADERRRDTVRTAEEQPGKEPDDSKRPLAAALDALDSEDDSAEREYAAWKVRERKRIKRDRADRRALAKATADTERLRKLTEEERRAELRAHGRVILNKALKGKYKFSRKSHQRAAFFMDEDEEVHKRDFRAAAWRII